MLLVSLPPGLTALVALRRGLSVHAGLVQDAPHTGGADLDLVIALQVHRDPVRPEVVALTKPENLLDNLGLGRPR